MEKISHKVRLGGCLLFSLTFIEQPRLEVTSADHLVQPFVGSGAWVTKGAQMGLIFYMKTTTFNFQCLCNSSNTKYQCEKDLFLWDSIANVTVPAIVIFVKVARL